MTLPDFPNPQPPALTLSPSHTSAPLLWQVQLVLEILERHPRLPLLVVSDSDTVWLRQPWPYFEQRPDADFFISSDCNSVDVSFGALWSCVGAGAGVRGCTQERAEPPSTGWRATAGFCLACRMP